jgi:hypothetical protein
MQNKLQHVSPVLTARITPGMKFSGAVMVLWKTVTFKRRAIPVLLRRSLAPIRAVSRILTTYSGKETYFRTLLFPHLLCL